MRIRLQLLSLALALAPIAGACGNAAGPDHSIRAAAGVYLLATVNGESVPTSDPSAAVDGTVYLWPTGHAERHVTYRRYDGGTEAVESVGSFHFEGTTLVLELAPKSDPTVGRWRVTGSLDDGTLTLGYPGPADGWMKEEYRRK